jgi:hypothetical protein
MEKGKVSSPLSDLYRMAFFILVCFQEHLGRIRAFGFDSDMRYGFRPSPVALARQ